MRRLTLILFAVMLCSVASAVPITLTIDWATSHPSRQFYNCAYNPATGHLVMNGGDQLYIFDASDGTFLGNTAVYVEPSEGKSFPFSLACTSDGVLYGTDLTTGGVVQYWADENTTGVFMPAPDVMMWGRGANVRGTSTSPTLYIAGGVDNDKMQILQLEATGTTWIVVSEIPAPAGKSYCGVQNPSRVMGMQPWGDDGHTSPNLGFPDVFNKVGDGYANSSWVRDDVFSPGDDFRYGVSFSVGGDYADGAWWVMYYAYPEIKALEGNYGAILGKVSIPAYGGYFWGVNPSISYYGNCTVDAANNTVYWGGRLGGEGSSITNRGHMGKATYNEPKPVINEVDYDQAGSPDNAEFVEIWGVPGTDISSYTLSIVNGTDGTESVIATIPPGTTIPDDAFYVVGMSGVPNVELVVGESLENGAPDAVVLRDYPGGTVIDALGYEMGGSGGAASLTAWSYEGAGYKGGDNFGSRFSLGRKADGVDTDDNQADFDVMWPTPGEKNQQFTLWASEMPYVDTFPTAGAALAWKSDLFPIRSIDPASVGAPESPEEWYLWPPGLPPSPHSVGRCDDPAGGGQVHILGDHNWAQRKISVKAWVYTGVGLESIGLFIRGIGDTGWHGSERSASSSSGYENCYALEWFDDGTSTCLRVIKMLATDGSITCFAFDPLNYNSPGWRLLVIWIAGSRIITCVDRAVFWDGWDSDIATGPVGIGFREARAGAALIGGLVDSIIIDNNFIPPGPEVTDWDLY